MKTWGLRCVVLVATAGLLGACMTGESGDDEATAGLDGTAWVLASLPGRDLLQQPVITIQFSDGRIGGTDGCNRFSGQYAVSDGTFGIPPPGLASTQMACAEAESNDQAQAFTTALTAARTYRIAEGTLALLDERGGTLATFRVGSSDEARD